MNEELSYAEMLEIPVETVTVSKKEKRKKSTEEDLKEKVVAQVNDRMEDPFDPLYAESTPIEREEKPKKGGKNVRRLLFAEFAAVCALCAAIFLTNIFLPQSAINTFVRTLFHGDAGTAADTRTYQEFTLSPIVNEFEEVELAVSETGVLSFTADCAVYSPCEGRLVSVNGDAESGYTVEVKHSDSFSTIISGLDVVYSGLGETVKSNIPLAHTDGEGEVRVMFYSDGSLLNNYTIAENTLAWA